MKYKSISLNGNKDYKYSLVKYEDKYKDILDSMEEIDVNLIGSVMECPVIYSINSDHQAYMIVKGDDIGVGATYIGTSTDEKDLEVKLQLDESKFNNETEMYMLINQLIDSLGLYCYDKENIYINLVNEIDLSKYNCLKYKREYLLPNISTYVCSNKKYNTLIPLLLEEIKSCEDTLVSWKQTWWQEVQNRPLCDLHYLFDDDFIIDRDIPLDEIFNKAESINWSSINSNTAERKITFNIDGDVSFTKSARKGSNSYEFKYNVREDGFVFNNSDISISDNSFETKINTKNEKVVKNKRNGMKRILYQSDIIDNTSVYLDLLLDNDEVEKCFIDFRTHKDNGKIKGMYLIRKFPKWHLFNFRYRNRKGNIYNYICNARPDDAISSFTDVKDIVAFYIENINCFFREGRDPLAEINIDLVNIDKRALDYMKQIKGEIPLPYLQEQIDKFILDYSKTKGNDKIKKLQ